VNDVLPETWVVGEVKAWQPGLLHWWEEPRESVERSGGLVAMMFAVVLCGGVVVSVLLLLLLSAFQIP